VPGEGQCVRLEKASVCAWRRPVCVPREGQCQWLERPQQCAVTATASGDPVEARSSGARNSRRRETAEETVGQAGQSVYSKEDIQ